METIECIKTRRTCYDFKKIEIGKLTLAKIIDAGRWAPSSGNLQNWRFVQVVDPEKKKMVAHATLQPQLVMSAPVVLVVCSVTSKVLKEFPKRGGFYAIQNTAAAIQNMLLAANDIDIGGTWIGAFAEPNIRKAIMLADDSVEIHAVLLFGYYKKRTKPVPRQDVHELIFFDEWKSKQAQKSFFPISKNLKRQANKLKELVRNIGK